jgi:hypothetical protein
MQRAIWCALLITGAGLAAAAPPVLAQAVNARLETVDAGGRLGPAIERLASRGGPLWVTWREPAAKHWTGCCQDSSDCEGCRLEPVAPGVQPAPLVRTVPEPLEGDTEIAILVRIEGGRLDRLRVVGASCPLDAGGLPFVTLTGVPAADSLAWLRALVDAPGEGQPRRLSESALHAISRHADAGAVPMLLDLARRHAEPRVRGSALVALARTAGSRLAPEIAAFVDSDPDTEVRKRAVFAVSQLPKDESVPLLIRIAREHRNPEVRRQAMFWLGQSKDPRAIEFFASVLK